MDNFLARTVKRLVGPDRHDLETLMSAAGSPWDKSRSGWTNSSEILSPGIMKRMRSREDPQIPMDFVPEVKKGKVQKESEHPTEDTK